MTLLSHPRFSSYLDMDIKTWRYAKYSLTCNLLILEIMIIAFIRIIYKGLYSRNLIAQRFAADIFNDAGILLTMLTPFLSSFNKNWTVPILCLSAVCRSLCGVTGGATRSGLTRVRRILLLKYYIVLW